MEERRNTYLFYTLVTFVAIVLSSWIITVSSYKDKENKILQTQIDSLVTVAKVYHGEDTIRILEKHLPNQTIEDTHKIKELIFIHTLVVATVILFIFLYIRAMSASGTGAGGGFLRKLRKKVN